MKILPYVPMAGVEPRVSRLQVGCISRRYTMHYRDGKIFVSVFSYSGVGECIYADAYCDSLYKMTRWSVGNDVQDGKYIYTHTGYVTSMPTSGQVVHNLFSILIS